MVLLCGGDKSTQARDILTAQKYWRDYLDAEPAKPEKEKNKTVPYREDLLKSLERPEDAAHYLNACLGGRRCPRISAGSS